MDTKATTSTESGAPVAPEQLEPAPVPGVPKEGVAAVISTPTEASHSEAGGAAKEVAIRGGRDTPGGFGLDLGRIAQDLQIRKAQVESVVHLLDEGNTVPFITRYRKERTGGLKEDVIRLIQARVAQQRALAERKHSVIRNIAAQGKLTAELEQAIRAAETSRRLEDLYLPYKPKKRTPASIARDRGLEPLAMAIWNRDPAVANLEAVLPTCVNPDKELPTVEDVRGGVQHILAELISETAEYRHEARRFLWGTGRIATSRADQLPEGQGLEYRDYFNFGESVRQIPPHRILAINRGVKTNVLKLRFEYEAARLESVVLARIPLADHPHSDLLRACALDAIHRLIVPSLEREIRRDLTEEAEDHAMQVFSRNLRSLLLQPPIRGRRVLAVDPGFRTGCKLAVLDEVGNVLDHGVIHPFVLHHRRPEKKHEPKPSAPQAAASSPPVAAGETAADPAIAQAPPTVQEPAPEPPREVPAPPPAEDPALTVQKRQESINKLQEIVQKHGVTVAAIGNGTACRETEELISELIAGPVPELSYVIVNEAGASHYSASSVGREEFPDFDATVRGTISIGRRLQDPLSELVKIDPQNIGVGLYQHDLAQKRLKEALEGVIESCVNHVGVDLNTASVPLLRHVSGLNQLTARAIVEYRKQHGPFRNREAIKQVPGVGPSTFTQAAGFLKVADGDNPLDGTWIHPESYDTARRLLGLLDAEVSALVDGARRAELEEKLKALSPEVICKQLEIGQPTLQDILRDLGRPGRDPREDLPPPVFKKGILRLEDLKPGMELKGTVLNVVDFGAFVDVGLKDSGLVHISQLANRYVKSPYDVVSVGDVVTVWVLNVDLDRGRVSLTMIAPGTERKPEERRPPLRREPAPGQPQLQGRRPAATQKRRQPQTGQAAPQAPRRPAPPQKRGYQAPKREKPPPELTEEALQGEQPLRTFAELKALYEAKKQS